MKRANANETPEERFKRIATLRTNAVLDRIRILGKLSDKRRYSYSKEDINKIFAVINRQVRETKAKFNSQKENRFKL